MAGQAIDDAQVRGILTQASALGGETLAEAEYAPLARAVGTLACCYCGRADVPEGMQAAVGALLVATLREQRREGVASVTRGDTAVTYRYDGLFALLPALSPWRRLAGPKEEG